MGNNKLLVDLSCSININCIGVYPYCVDRVYFALTNVECLLLVNIIFLVNVMFNVEYTEIAGGIVFFENVGRFLEALMNIQVGRMVNLCQPVLYNLEFHQETLVHKYLFSSCFVFQMSPT